MGDRPDAPAPGGPPAAGAEGGPAHGLGKRLRDARERSGLSLRELARRVGVSASLVSQIETERILPSVSTLYAVVSELGVSMDAVVFGAERGTATAGRRPPGRSAARDLALTDPIIQRRDARDIVPFGSGVQWELLTPVPVAGAEFLLVVYEPGAESSPAGTFQRHAGREWSYVISGTLHVSVAFDDYVLGPGDSITYDSTVPHRLANHGTEPVEALWFQIGQLPAPPER